MSSFYLEEILPASGRMEQWMEEQLKSNRFKQVLAKWLVTKNEGEFYPKRVAAVFTLAYNEAFHPCPMLDGCAVGAAVESLLDPKTASLADGITQVYRALKELL
jgi:hypothetical protein